MNDRTLLRKLVVVVLVKLAALTGLWWAFMHDARVEVAAHSVAEHLGARPDPHASQGNSHGQ
jgi:hypothetical protein